MQAECEINVHVYFCILSQYINEHKGIYRQGRKINYIAFKVASYRSAEKEDWTYRGDSLKYF